MGRHKNRGRIVRCNRSRYFLMLNTNIKFKPVLMKLLRRKLVVYKDILKPRINRDISWLAQSRTTKTLL